MEKRYQVFVSSTYEDLKEERRVVMQTLLETDCIPAGMELFSAEDEDQWSVIKRVIDDCDYYIVIVGGRYGTMTSDGKSYTQKEYEYAISQGIPVMAFLPEDPNNIPAGKTDDDPEKKQRLEEFKIVLKNRLCKTWNNPDHLAGAVSISINHMIRNKPAIGWIKADQMQDETSAREILRLKNQIEVLENELENRSFLPPRGAEDLAQGDDIVSIKYIAYIVDYDSGEKIKNEFSTSLTWNKLFTVLAPQFLLDIEKRVISNFLGEYFRKEREDYIRKRIEKYRKDFGIEKVEVKDEDLETILVQFRSLGHIDYYTDLYKTTGGSEYKKLVWRLTPYGEREYSRIRAIKRSVRN